MNLSYIIGTHGNITLFGGEGARPINVPTSHSNYQRIIDALKDPNSTDEEILDLSSLPQYLSRRYSGRVEVIQGVVHCDGYAFNNLLTQRILEFAEQDLPVDPLVRFMERLVRNPSSTAVEELYDFLEHKQLPITPTGTFIAYKAVGRDYMDLYSHTILNNPGMVVSLPRNRVDDNRNHGCSRGLHVGTYDYAVSYGGGQARSLMLIAEVDPADVVSVPHDCSNQKLRTCRYKVLKVVEQPIDEVYWDGDEEDDFYDSDEIEVTCDCDCCL